MTGNLILNNRLLKNFTFKEPPAQIEEFTEYEIIVILTDLDCNDCLDIHAEIFSILANLANTCL